jgi:molybdenum cofactor cytidylyltransferase
MDGNAKMKTVAGLILAAGKSDRMGSPKPLLRIYGKTFLEHIVTEVRRSKVGQLKVVLGHKAETVLKSLPSLPAEILINPDYHQGQLSSLITGLQTLQGSSAEALILFLVDHPFVTCEVVDLLIQQFSQSHSSIVIPTHHGRRGHPVIFGRQLFSELLHAPLDQGAALVVRSHQTEILHVEVEDQGILIDIDTPEAYREYVVEQGIVL